MSIHYYITIKWLVSSVARRYELLLSEDGIQPLFISIRTSIIRNPHGLNYLERLFRCTPMGRKNYLFSWTETGAEHIAIIQSLLVSCRLQDIDPYKYLIDVLQKVSLNPARQINELIPKNWKERFGKNPLKAPLDK